MKNIKTQRFYIEGMSCSSCSSGIEKSLKRKDFISDIQVNLLSKTAKVSYDESQTSLEDIFAIISKLGYTPRLDRDNILEENISLLQKFEKKFLSPKRKIILTIIFTLGTLYLSMGGMFFEDFVPSFLLESRINAVLQLLFTLVVMHMGRMFYFRGFGSLLMGNPNMDTLVAIGTGSAFFYSFYLVVNIFMGAEVGGLYFEGVCMIIMFVLIGKNIEERSKSKATDALKRLMSHTSKTTIRVKENKEQEISIDEISINDTIKILPGSHIPVDGVILEGEVNIDESMLSGEVLPVFKVSGQQVYSGTINTDKAFLIRAIKSAQDSTLNQIIHLIQCAQESKAPIARIADKISGIFVPVVIVIAILAGIFWWVYQGDFGFGLQVFVSVLVISCPCALGLATPMSIMIGSGRAAYGGIFFKNAKSLENTQKVTTVVFDKTGTLSIGKPVVQKVLIFDDALNQEELVALASGVESGSEHLIAKSIIGYANNQHIAPKKAKDFHTRAGYGISANIDGRIIKLGNEESFKLNSPLSLPNDGSIVVLVGEEGDSDRLLGALILKDKLKPNIKEYIAILKNMGIKTILLSGDNQPSVKAIADEIGIDEAIAKAKPSDKLEKIKSLKKQKEIVMMVGDGMNDAPALAVADISLVMAKGSDVSVQVADIISFSNDIKSVINAISLSGATIKNIKENLFWAFCYNVVFIPLACGVGYEAGVLLNPMIASLAMSLSSLSVVLNAQRLRKFKFKD
ncbi:heavy metal translocating P-type ATPase [Helicobacter cappadocius]|uniref:Copper-transporting ATPase n=1 Tax=Helicobacter cappadocius TaxID=3063998 RepID=A0AA90SRT9_9HELI|nr:MULTISPECIES: heavy metal translocating P-type ATPase [unclassified Helicobacter]MDO7252322.1 heavy metal translocating P-type ATPase [Helicobacter sp. faydin-H75]MDP2538189.1 heavy metal translocating P-type ATPase [Helicobacter sp. faydin-H76]